MKLSRPIVFFDLEGTGTDVAKDKIVSVAAVKMAPNSMMRQKIEARINPGVAMSEEVMAIHGITNEMVASAHKFDHYAQPIHEFMIGCDLAGFNLFNYDIPLLWEELYRCGIEWNLSGVNVIDAGNIFKKKEERTLSAAVKFYCGREHDGAHEALADVHATIDVLEAQMNRYPDMKAMDVGAVAEFSKFDNRVDLAGKIVRDANGDPVYNIGKSKGVKVKDDLGFAYWMLGRDFTANTKSTLQKIIDDSSTPRGVVPF